MSTGETGTLKLSSGIPNFSDNAVKPIAVWHDSDRGESFHTVEEPEWVTKRRKVLKEKKESEFVDAEGLSSIQLNGNLAKSKPSKHASDVRFKIERQNDSRQKVLLSEIKKVEFDGTGTFLAVLGKREKGIKLYSVDGQKSRCFNKFRLKSQVNEIIPEKYSVSNFAFSDKSILIIASQRSLLKYDIEKGRMFSIASIANLRMDKMYSGIYTPPATNSDCSCNYFAISCHDGGGLLVCDSRTNSIAHRLQMNATTCAGVGFHPRINAIISADSDSNIYEWDLRTGRCNFRFKDNHSVHISSFSVSSTVDLEYSRNTFVAAGSRSGFLNLFPIVEPDTTCGSDSMVSHLQVTPIKSFGNLSTEITSIAIEASGDLVAYSSIHKRNAIRIIHVPTNSVISNWPTDKVNLGRVTDISFCSKYQTLAVGNRTGKVQFFKIMK